MNDTAIDRAIRCYHATGNSQDAGAAVHQLASLNVTREQHAKLQAALEAVYRWRGLCDGNDMETYERIADLFYKETGYLRPGKDCVRHDPEERSKHWDAWVARKNRELNTQIRCALEGLMEPQ